MTIVALLLAAAVSSTPVPAPTPVPCASGASAASLPQEFLGLINATRKKRGLSALRLSEPLCRSARTRAEAIGKGSSSLDAMEGENLLSILERDGYEARYAGELLVQASGTPREIVAGWSRDLMANEGFGEPAARDLGIGVSQLEGTPLYVFFFAQGAAEEFRERTGGIAERDAVLAKMLEMVNAQRRKRNEGAGALRRNSLLDRAAQGHAEDMLARSFYGHESPEGRDAWYRARAAGYRALMIGENVAQGQSSLEEVMKGWMDSPDHRKNILNPEYTEAGFGVAVGKNAQGYQVLWVQVFGKPR